jgi:hypothetical protein
MKLASMAHLRNLFSRLALFGAMLRASSLSDTRAAELVMFEQAGCVWCETFNREVAPVYDKTLEGKRAPLRRVDISQSVPGDLAFLDVERLTPVFVLVDRGREIGRIRGYPGEDHFWGLLGVLIEKLDKPGTGAERAQVLEKHCTPSIDRLYSQAAPAGFLAVPGNCNIWTSASVLTRSSAWSATPSAPVSRRLILSHQPPSAGG